MKVSSLIRFFIGVSLVLGTTNFFVMLLSTGFDFRSLVFTVVAVGIVTMGFGYVLHRLKPINDLIRLVNDVKNGKLNVNIDVSALRNDEIGILTKDVYGFVNIIRSIVEDLSSISHKYNGLGESKYRIDPDKYENAYREMIKGVNSILDEEVENITSLVNTLNQINAGDFDVQVNELPGDFIFQTHAIRDVIANLKGVSLEVNEMIEAAVGGDLNFKADASKYQGDWRKIMVGLSRIAKAVDQPLKVIKVSLDVMKAGNFDLAELDKKLVAMGLDPNAQDYKGVFRESINSIEETMPEIASYINEIGEVLAKMAEGDLRNKIERKYVGSFDLIKSSVNNINGTLHKTMSEISNASGQVLSGAVQISNSANDLASGAQRQASSVQQLNAAIDMINQQTQQNADNALTANELSNKSTTNAQEGNSAMAEMVEAMSKIKESSNNISQIVNTIQDIAFQTNLLALNASVEAARAGEHGKGFAVVADEVRNLAGRSQTAATETTTLIQDSINRVESGSSIAETTAESLNEIVTSASEVLEIIGKISASSKEQAEAIANVSQGLTQISDVTQSNSSVSEETAAASQELNSQAELLRQLVSYFKL